MTNKEACGAAIKARINGNKEHGWGVEDSYRVMLAVIANETGSEVNKDLDSPEFGQLIKQLVNPSQFRQKIEGSEEEVKAGKKLLLKSEKTRKSGSDIMNELGL